MLSDEAVLIAPPGTPDLEYKKRLARLKIGHMSYDSKCHYEPDEKPALATLAVIVHDRYELLLETLKRLQEVTPEFREWPWEWVVIDNGSTDDRVKEWCEGVGAWVLRNPRNLGVAPARNQVLMLSSGDPIVMLDPDLWLPEGWLADCMRVLSVPDIAMCSVNAEGRRYETVTLDGVKIEIKCPGNIAGVWVLPRRTTDFLGFFSEDYRWYGGEDSDYGARAEVAGLHNAYIPDKEARHLGHDDGCYGTSTSEYTKRKRLWFNANMILFRRYYDEYLGKKRPFKIETPGPSLVEGRPGMPIYWQPYDKKALEIGAGVLPLPGFVHLDVQDLPDIEIVHDVVKEPLPMEEGEWDMLYSSHFLEHVPWRKVKLVLGEFYRVLRPGGTLELHLPNIANWVKCKTWEDLQLNYMGGQMHMWDAHLSTYSPDTLEVLMEEVGFEKVEFLPALGDFDMGMGGTK